MRFYEAILKYPKSVIAIILLITLFFGWQMRKVELNNSMEALLPQNDPSVQQDREIKQVFNSREMILIGVIHDEGIFNPATLQKVKELTEAVWGVTVTESSDERGLKRWGEKLGGRCRETIQEIVSDGLTVADRGSVSNLLVAAKNDPALPPDFIAFLETLQLKLKPISDVISLADVDNITSTDWGLSIDPPIETVPQTADELAELKATVLGNEMFIDGLVSKDGTGTAILVELSFYYDDYLELAHRVFQKLEALAAPYRGPEQVRLAGVPMVNVYTSNYMSGDLAKLTPLVILLVMVVMYLSFRVLKGVFIPILVVLVALVWTLGIMGIFGRPITIVVSAMPVILIAIGIADGIHVITEYQLLWAKFKDRDRAILQTMRELTMPVIFTTLTDMAGFSSLAISDLQSIKDFGIFTSVGAFAGMVFSLTFIPAALKLMKPPEAHFGKAQSEGKWSSFVLERLGRVAVQRRRWVFVFTGLLIPISILAITQLGVGSRMVGYFKKRSEIYQASEMINAKFGGTEVMNIVVNTKTKDGLKNPETLGKIAALGDTLESLDVVGYTTSLADYVKRINLVMHNNDADFNRIPNETETVTETDWVEEDGKEVEVERQVEISGRDQIAQYLLLYENAGGEYLDKLADYDYTKANIVAQIRTDHTPELRKVKELAEQFATANFGEETEVTYAGCSSLCIVADDLIIPSQLKSLGFALIVVFLLLALIFRSVKYALLGLLPLVLTILFAFTLMSVFGVYLDAATALIASIVLGVGIDYSIHFLYRYRALRKEGVSSHDAISETLNTSGRAILFNAAAVSGGFLVLMLSSFWPVIHIGWLVAVNMLSSAILTMVLMPAVLMSRRKREVSESKNVG